MKSVDRLHDSEIGSSLSVDAGKTRKLMTDAMATSKVGVLVSIEQ